MDIAQEVIAAEWRIRPYIRKTILEYSLYYSKLADAEVRFKLGNLQHTGSFKLRGAMNKMLSLSRTQRVRGVVTASTGKAPAIEQLGAEVRYFGDDTADTEAHARNFTKK